MIARLEWEIRYKRDYYSVQAAQEKGRDLPAWFLECPLLGPFEDFYIEAFWQLTTCRAVTDAYLGAIPWRDIVAFADLHDMDPEMFALFQHVIMAMDGAYLAKQAEAAKNKKPSGDDPPSPKRRAGTLGNR